MANDTFKFKEFVVRHDRSSMRVGTDAVLLGAWAHTDVSYANKDMRVLDIGCGCGLIALMVAQRFPFARVCGIDIDAPSVDEAMENATNSPFSERVRFQQADVRQFALDEASGKYDLIVCNPPYYTEDTLPPDMRRSKARNTSCLSFEELLGCVRRLLATDGVFSVIIPMQARDGFVGKALLNGLCLFRECCIHTVLGKTSKRVLLELGLQQYTDVKKTALVLQDSSGKRSADYALLCKDFYL